MIVDSNASVTATPAEAEAAAVQAEAEGYDGFGVPETRHDVFTSLTLAARATTRITLQSGIAVAFARNPMTVAVQANDLQLVSGGRFQLGLGSQVGAHIERRFSMPWGQPAARMEEFVAAIRAIWHSWATGERLAFRGEHYRHTLMTEFFSPGPNPHGNPPIYVAAVGPKMTAVAGRAADGMMVHPLTSRRFLTERTLPMLIEARGSLDDFTLCLPVLVVLGSDEAKRAVAEKAIRHQIAFYASTPAYRGVLDLHGWGELGDRLNLLSRRQEWAAMSDAIDDEVLDTFAVAGDATAVAAGLRERFGDLVQRISLYTPYETEASQVADVALKLRG